MGFCENFILTKPRFLNIDRALIMIRFLVSDVRLFLLAESSKGIADNTFTFELCAFSSK